MTDLPPDDPRDGAHETLQLDRPDQAAVERVWREYWAPLLTGDGHFSMRQLKAELYDAFHLVDNARAVYRHVTGGLCENLCASADGVIAMADRRVAQLEAKLLERIAELERDNENLRRGR